MMQFKEATFKPYPFLLIITGSLIVMALFPYGWLAEVWPLFGWAVNAVFGSDLAHIIGHIFIFMVLGGALLLTLPRLRRWPIAYFGLMLGLGWMQEYFQLVSFKNRPFTGAELFDLVMDLIGATLIWFLLTRE